MDAEAELARLAELWRGERQAARERYAEERRGLTLAERVERGVAVRELVYQEHGAAPGGRARVVLAAARPRELDGLRIGGGDPVRLWREHPDEEGAVEAVLSRVREGRVTVIVDGDVDPLVEGRLQLDREAPEATFDRGDRALSAARTAKPTSDLARIRDVLVGARPARFAPAPSASASGSPEAAASPVMPAANAAAATPPAAAGVGGYVSRGSDTRAAERSPDGSAANAAAATAPAATGVGGYGERAAEDSPDGSAANAAAATPPAATGVGGSLSRGSDNLHAAQRAAVARALAALDVALIHGPPGTGKTHTLVEVIRRAVENGERVLATAASNTAVDNLAERLVDAGLSIVRLGHPARISPAIEAVSLDALLERSEAFGLARRWLAEADAIASRARKRKARGSLPGAELRAALDEAGALRRDARRHLRDAERAILARAQVVCATAAGADLDEIFDLVVLDEATQAVDPVALCALARGRRAVLAGDPCQLPPTVLDRAAAAAGLGRTFFERLAERSPPSLLVEQHRMHRAIMAFPSQSMYGGALVAAPAVAEHRLEDLGVAPDSLRPGPLVFIDTAGKGWSDERGEGDASTRNPGQAARTAAEARRLLGRGLHPTQLAVITPYDAQVRLLRDLLAAERDAGLEIGTVDGFQGREKEAVIVDVVRSNDDCELGFLADIRRMNVALTRARRFLLVVGDSATLGGHPYYRAFLEAVEAAGAHVSAWADDADPW